MRIRCVLCIVLWSLACSATLSAQSAFAPLDLWKNAVENRDTTALTELYSIAPRARVKSPQGVTDEVGADPHFWSALAASGLSDLQPKILEIEHLEPGVVALVLRIEFNLRTDSGMQPFVIGASQVWAQEGNEWRIIQTQRGDLAERTPRRLPEPATPDTDLYPPPQEARAEIKAALARAEKDHKRVILVFGGNWCYDCHVLNATFHSKDIAPLVSANFHVVHVNIGDDYDKNLDLAAKYQVPLKRGVPALVVLNPDGSLVYSQQEGEFENSERLSPADVTEFLKKWAPPRQN
jgi:thioredoxin 1